MRPRAEVRRKKNRIRLWHLLIATGVLVVIYTAFGQLRAVYLQRKAYADLLRYTASVTAEADLGPGAGPDTGMGTGNPTSSTDTSDPAAEPQKELGILVIPKIDVTVRVLEGTGPEQLYAGVGHVQGTALPGEKGNSVLPGHRTSFRMHPFLDLDKVEDGDTIQFVTETRADTFEVFKTFVTDPYDTSVLDQDKTQTTLTLFTCHPAGTTESRLVVQASLVEK